MRVTVRYWAAAKDAAGRAEESFTELGTLAELLAAVRAHPHATGDPARLSAVLKRSSFIVDGEPVGLRAPEAVQLSEGSVVEVLPPFAGG